MNRRNFTLGAGAGLLLSGCLWDKHFDLSWDEEVQLHDGRVIVVKLKHTFERLQPGFGRYGGTNILRDTTLTFDAGGLSGTVSQLFKGHHPLFIGQADGVWYTTIYGAPYYRSQEIPGQNWGLHWYDCNPAAKLGGQGFEPISIHDLPAIFQEANVLVLNAPADELAKFNNGRVTLKDKEEWLQTHRSGYGFTRICRPPDGAVKPADIFRDEKTQGVQK